MKKLLFISIALILVSIVIFTGCGGATETTTASKPPTTQPTTSQPTTSQPTTTPITKGGTLRCIANAIPKDLGYGPEKAPSDNYYMLPVIERLTNWNTKGEEVPLLAKSWDVDEKALTVTWHLQSNVKFSDGTAWNADALRWNYQQSIDNNRLTDQKYITSMEVKDDLTLVMHLSAFNWTMIENWGLLMQAISPTAFRTAGGTIAADSDIEASKTWARANAVGTGPFIVSSFQRDVVIKFAKNPNYWQPGMPYLDGIELWYIPDPMTAAAKIEAKEADMWFAVSSVQNIVDLRDKGFQIVWGPGMFTMLLPASNDPDSPLHIKEVREAIEYAIDRPAIAEMLGQGLFEPLTQMASSTWPGYVQGYNARPFNPVKAKQLLNDAGYQAGFSIKIMATSAGTDAVAALQSYLGDVGITVVPDIADLADTSVPSSPRAIPTWCSQLPVLTRAGPTCTHITAPIR